MLNCNQIAEKVWKRCLPKEPDKFRKEGDVTDTDHGVMIHIDRGADILAVGHLDWVKWRNPQWDDTSKRIYKTPQLDDRLGVALILDVLPEMGVECDVLLCDSEEVGNSTAQYFTSPPKDYKWMFEFDRAGTDVVMYDYWDREIENKLEDIYDWEVGRGSFTDICELTHLGITGFNFGCGYHYQHQDRCYGAMRETVWNLYRFFSFYMDHKDVEMPWEKSSYTKGHWGYYTKSSGWNSYETTVAVEPKKNGQVASVAEVEDDGVIVVPDRHIVDNFSCTVCGEAYDDYYGSRGFCRYCGIAEDVY